jgi:hypothetical protein
MFFIASLVTFLLPLYMYITDVRAVFGKSEDESYSVIS